MSRGSVFAFPGCFSRRQPTWAAPAPEDEEEGMRMEKLKLMSKTFTLTPRETGPLKQPSYRVCKDGEFYYFSLEKEFEELVERWPNRKPYPG